MPFGGFPSYADAKLQMEVYQAQQKLRQQIKEVQEGIHALTGRSAAVETRSGRASC